MNEERFKELDVLSERKQCPKCTRKRLYFCYDCYIYTPEVSKLVPTIRLPYQIDVIKHPKELNGKSTAIHSALLAPDQTRIFTYEDSEIPRYNEELNQINTVLVFPDKDAISVEEFVKKSDRPIQRLLFLDGTWNNIKQLNKMPQIQNVPTVALKAYKTEYWRPQLGYSDECLATIEAIYYAIRETWQAQNPDKEYAGDFDDMLFWFWFFKSKFINAKE